MIYSKTIGLIAGEGRLPIIYAKALKTVGIRPIAIGFVEETDRSLDSIVEDMAWLRLGQVKRAVKFLREKDVRELVMVGKVPKIHLFRKIRPDITAMKIMSNMKDHRDDSILKAVTDYLEEEGFTITESCRYVPNLVTPSGLLCGRLTKERRADLTFGWKMAQEIGRLDIGQTVVVRRQAILAIEAIEGTDEAIKRGALLGRGSATVVKVAKPSQDMRFDVPVVGLRTITAMVESGAKVLGIEAGRSLFIDREQSLQLAKEHRLVIAGLTSEMINTWEN